MAAKPSPIPCKGATPRAINCSLVSLSIFSEIVDIIAPGIFCSLITSEKPIASFK